MKSEDKAKKRPASRSLALTGLFTAMIMLLTLAKIPVPWGTGYIHLGDAAVFAACMIIGWRAVPASAIGSVLADLLNGYAVYMIPTFIIKGIMAGIVVLITLPDKKKRMQALAFTLASVWMQGAYLLFEFLFATTLTGGIYASLAVPFLIGLIQSAIGVPLGIYLTHMLKKIKIEYISEKKEP